MALFCFGCHHIWKARSRYSSDVSHIYCFGGGVGHWLSDGKGIHSAAAALNALPMVRFGGSNTSEGSGRLMYVD